MTVGVVVVIPGGVVAVADGRTSMVFQEEIVSDTTRKIIQGPGGTTMIAFGVTHVTAAALIRIFVGPSPRSGHAAVALARSCLQSAWLDFSIRLAPEIDRTNSALRAALVIAGIDETGPYIGAAMVSFDSPLSVGPSYGDYNNVVLGAEQHGSSEMFIRELNQARSLITSADTSSVIAHKIAEAAANTIQTMARLDRTVGGQIHYRIQLIDKTVIEANHGTRADA